MWKLVSSSVPPVSTTIKEEHGPCQHYPTRKCYIKSPCCNEYYPCRFCHDEGCSTPSRANWNTTGASEDNATNANNNGGSPRYVHRPHSSSMSAQCSQAWDRQAVKEIRCNLCGSEQEIQERCNSCDVKFGDYFCRKCALYSSPTSEGIYHCDKCGICRVGKGLGIDFFHCDRCAACYLLSTKQTHVCMNEALQRECPICLKNMFDSREMVFVGPKCGHAMHSSCAKYFQSSGYHNCPICKQAF